MTLLDDQIAHQRDLIRMMDKHFQKQIFYMNETINKHNQKQKEIDEKKDKKLIPSLSEESFSLHIPYREENSVHLSKTRPNECSLSKNKTATFSLNQTNKNGKIHTLAKSTPRFLLTQSNSSNKSKK